jgi:hypothetical protein
MTILVKNLDHGNRSIRAGIRERTILSVDGDASAVMGCPLSATHLHYPR